MVLKFVTLSLSRTCRQDTKFSVTTATALRDSSALAHTKINNMDITFVTVEPAASNRATCKSCGHKIIKGENKLIYSDHSFVFGGTTDKSLCRVCAKIILTNIIKQLG